MGYNSENDDWGPWSPISASESESPCDRKLRGDIWSDIMDDESHLTPAFNMSTVTQRPMMSADPVVNEEPVTDVKDGDDSETDVVFSSSEPIEKDEIASSQESDLLIDSNNNNDCRPRSSSESLDSSVDYSSSSGYSSVGNHHHEPTSASEGQRVKGKRKRNRPSNPDAVKKCRQKKANHLQEIMYRIEGMRLEASRLQTRIKALDTKAVMIDFKGDDIPEDLLSKKHAPRHKEGKYKNEEDRREARKKSNRQTSMKKRQKSKIEEKNIHDELSFWETEIPLLKERLLLLRETKPCLPPPRGSSIRKQSSPCKRIVS